MSEEFKLGDIVEIHHSGKEYRAFINIAHIAYMIRYNPHEVIGIDKNDGAPRNHRYILNMGNSRWPPTILKLAKLEHEWEV